MVRRFREAFFALVLASTFAYAANGYDFASVMAAILKTESGGRPYAIFDNTTRKSYQLSSRAEAEKMASYLISLNHNIDMGLYQINSFHLSRGWTVTSIFDTNFNRKAAETIFTEWLNAAKKLYGDTALAWERAIGAYNAGNFGLKKGNPVYVNKVLRAMGAPAPAIDKPDETPTANPAPRANAVSLGGIDSDEDEDPLEEIGAPSSDNAALNSAGDAAAAIVIVLVLLVTVKILGFWFLRLVARLIAAGTKQLIQRAKATAEA